MSGNLQDVAAHLTDEIKGLRADMAKADAARQEALEELRKAHDADKSEIEQKLQKIADDMAAKAKRLDELSEQLDDITSMLDRPSGGLNADGSLDEQGRKDAIEFYRMQHVMKAADPVEALRFDESQVDFDAYAHYLKGLHKYLHAPRADDVDTILTPEEKKALSVFAAGGSYFFSPQMSRQVFSCLEEETDVLSLLGRQNIRRGSLKLPMDNSWDEAAWACEKDCFANNPSAKLLEGLGEKEITAHALRYTACTTREFLEDAEIDVAGWLAMKVRDAMRRAMNRGFMTGDGNGQPMGILNTNSGIGSITAQASGSGGAPAGGFTWQDLVSLAYAVPEQYHGPGFAYFTSQEGMAYILTMTGADGHPIIKFMPEGGGRPTIAGFPVRVNTWMPKPAAGGLWPTGSVPVTVGNWRQAYLVVMRRAITMQRDDYSAGYCVLWKTEARVGGDVVCANAAKHLKVR